MKFGKRIRKELSPSLLRGSIDYKALKGIAKTARQLQQELQLHLNGGGGNGWSNTDPSDRVDEFFARLEVERVKVAEFYRTREAWCFLTLERTRRVLFALTLRVNEDKLSSPPTVGFLARSAAAADASRMAPLVATCGARGIAVELEGKFLETKASMSVLLAECGDLVKFVDMNMHAFRKVLKKLDKWTGGERGRVYFTDMMQNHPWISGCRAQGVLRMASAMTEHLRSLHAALTPRYTGGGGQPSSWVGRIVYSVGSFDKPKLYPGGVPSSSVPAAACQPSADNTQLSYSYRPALINGAATSADSSFADASRGDRSDGNGSGGVNAVSPSSTHSAGQETAVAEAVATEATAEGSRLRFLREFGAIVIVGVYSDAAHAACHGGVLPVEALRDRIARVSPHADRVVAVDSWNSAHVRKILLDASAGVTADIATLSTAVGPRSGETAAAVAETGAGPKLGAFSEGTGGINGSVNNLHAGACWAGTVKRNGTAGHCPRRANDAEVPPPPPESSISSPNCCFVTCDWDGGGARRTEEGRRVRRDTLAAMGQCMPVFPLPSPTWGSGSDDYVGNEEEHVDVRVW